MTDLTWTDWPAPRQPARSALAVVLIGVAVLATATVDPWLAVVGALVLVVSTSEALLPTRYEVSEEGVAVLRPFTHRRQPWSRFRGFRQTPEGFVLLGEGSRPVLRRHRTVVLRQPPAEVAAALASHLPGAAACAS